jgi:hypothetical protein
MELAGAWRAQTPKSPSRKSCAPLERGKARVLMGREAYFVEVWQRLKPETYWNLIARQFKDPSSPKSPTLQ